MAQREGGCGGVDKIWLSGRSFGPSRYDRDTAPGRSAERGLVDKKISSGLKFSQLYIRKRYIQSDLNLDNFIFLYGIYISY